MFSHKDIEFRTIMVVNCLESRTLRVSNGELLLEDCESKKTLTKLPFSKILALFVIGHISITTPLLDKCKKFNVALVVMKPNFRPVFFWSSSAEANYLLRMRQYALDRNDISIAKLIVFSKVKNQLSLLCKTRCKDGATEGAKQTCRNALLSIDSVEEYTHLMGLEGRVAKSFFLAYFQKLDWSARKPRTKCDALNATLDIGYTILFNYVEVFVRMFGFDPYVGVYHRLWFKRKSLICDLMEPFRCIIDRQVRTGFNRGEFCIDDFKVIKNEYVLKYEKNSHYQKVFYDALIPIKMEMFKYIQSYYRSFMQDKMIGDYPEFNI